MDLPAQSHLHLPMPSWLPTLERDGSYDDHDAMNLAIELSRRNSIDGEGGPFGAVVTDATTGALVACGLNRVRALGSSCLHAEVVAIIRAQQRLRVFSLDAAPHTLYSSCAPCAMCLGAIHWSGVSRIVCGASKEDAEAIGFDEGPVFAESYRYLEASGVEVVTEFKREQAAAVLRSYGGVIYNGRPER